jgi:hypothetical protein
LDPQLVDDQTKENRQMRNPMWFVEEKLKKVKNGERALQRELARSARSLSDNVGLDGKFAAEVFRQVLHRLILVTIEMEVLSLFHQLMPGRPSARIYSLRVQQP